MNATEMRVEQAIAREGITDNDEAIKPTDEVVEDDSPKKDDSEEEQADDKQEESKPKYDKDGNRLADDEETEEAAEEETADDTEGEFTAEDGEEVEEVAASEPTQPTDASGVVLSTAEQKFIADNIGEPIVLKGYRGTGDNAKEVEIKAYSVADIPADFKFANDQQMLAAQTGFIRLETKAEKLLGDFRAQQTQTQAKDYEERENRGIQLDLAELQNEGAFPKFKIKPGEKGFDDDPAAQQMAEVLELMTARNDQFLKEYNQGRPWKHIGFREAFELWEKGQTTRSQERAQVQEDTARKKTAKTVGRTGGMATDKLVKPTVKRGTTTRDILNRIDNGDF